MRSDIALGLLEQNKELGLTQSDIDCMTVNHKLGKKNSTAHWVLETSPEVFKKVENKNVLLGMTRCAIKLYKNAAQCFRSLK